MIREQTTVTNSTIQSSSNIHTSQAVVCSRHGNPVEVSHVEQQKIPTPKAGQVLVRMLAAPINPSDYLFIRGDYGIGPKLPGVPGFEGVGIVEKVGSGWLSRGLLGMRVAVLSEQGGTWANYCVTSAKTVIPLPKELTDDQAASFFINPATAYLLTRVILPVPLGNWIMQSAAASSLGRMVIRLGRHFNFRTINIVRKQSQVAELKQLGANAVIVANEQTTQEEFRNKIRQICLGTFPKFAIDPVGGHIGSLMLDALGQDGKMQVFASLSDRPICVHPRDIVVKNLKIEGFLLNRTMEQFSLRQKVKLVRTISRLHVQGIFGVEDFRRFPLSQLNSALAETESAPGGVKVILAPTTNSSD